VTDALAQCSNNVRESMAVLNRCAFRPQWAGKTVSSSATTRHTWRLNGSAVNATWMRWPDHPRAGGAPRHRAAGGAHCGRDQHGRRRPEPPVRPQRLDAASAVFAELDL
jgi:hypothetical protein